MPTVDKIAKTGAYYRERFVQVDFLGEVEIPESDLEELCLGLRKSLHRINGSNDHSALLATVVVNLAFYNRSELDSDSFRQFVLSKLRGGKHPVDISLWDETVGPATLGILKRYFGAEDIPGPYRYVRPVMEQAGVSYSVLSQFTDFFLQLTKRHGLRFSFQNYESFLRTHTPTSRSLRNFLDTSAGHHYCREVGRIVGNVRHGLLRKNELGELPARVRETISVILKADVSKRGTQKDVTSISPPQLAIDTGRFRLKLIFPDLPGQSGITYRLSSGTPIFGSQYTLRYEDLESGVISGSIASRFGNEDWEVEIWQPEINPWAIFAVSSGCFLQSNGKVAPGEYLVVLPADYGLPEVIEECGYLDHPTETLFKIIHAELSEGFSINEIDFRVAAASASTPPFLQFDKNRSPVRYSTNVFLDTLPQIRIHNWAGRNESSHMLVMEVGDARRRIADDAISDDRVAIEVRAPQQGRISIESKGKMTRRSLSSSLSFTVIPGDYDLVWEERLYSQDCTPRISFSPADAIATDGTGIKEVAKGVWEVSPGFDLIEPRVTYAKSVSFPLTIPVYRLRIYGDIVDGNILWHEKLKTFSELTVEVSPRERNQSIEIGVTNRTGYRKICDSKSIPANLQLVLKTHEIRDAFADARVPAGLISVKTRNSGVVVSNITYLNDELIRNLSLSDDSDFDDWSEYLPAPVLESILAKRRSLLLKVEVDEHLEEIEAPEHLVDWFASGDVDFSKVRTLVEEWISCCRSEFWNKAKRTEIGSSAEGSVLTEALQTYYDALGGAAEGKKTRCVLYLENVYHRLEPFRENLGIVPEIANFLSFMCCLRLKKQREAFAVLQKLGPNWDLIKSRLGVPVSTDAASNTDQFGLDDVMLHRDDGSLLKEDLGLSSLGQPVKGV